MQTTFLTTLANALAGTKHRLDMTVESSSATGLKILITANLGPTPEKASAAEAQLRAAMCRPLIITGSAEDVEADLVKRLTHHVRALDQGQSLLDEILQIGSEVRANAKTAPVAVENDDAATPDSSEVELEADDDTHEPDLAVNAAEVSPFDKF